MIQTLLYERERKLVLSVIYLINSIDKTTVIRIGPCTSEVLQQKSFNVLYLFLLFQYNTNLMLFVQQVNLVMLLSDDK